MAKVGSTPTPGSKTEPNLTCGSHLQLEESQKTAPFILYNQRLGELYFPSPMTREALEASSFAYEPYDSAGPELQNAIRPDLNTVADPLKPLAIIDKGSVRAFQVLQEKLVSVKAQRGVAPRHLLVRNHNDVPWPSPDRDNRMVIKIHRDSSLD